MKPNPESYSPLVIEVEEAMIQRGDVVVSRALIAQALELIHTGAEQVSRYPNGKPSLKDVYKIAWRLFKEKHD